MIFLTFVGQPHAKTSFSRPFLEGTRPKIVSEVGVLHEAVLNKSNKNIALECHPSNFCRKNIRKCAIWNSSAGPPDPYYQVSESAAGTLPSTRAGGQDGGS